MSALELDDAKGYLGMDLDKHTEDTDLQGTIDAAEAIIGQRCGPIASTTVTRRIRGGSWQLVLPVLPVISLTSVTPYSGTALTLGDLYVDPVTGLVTFNTLSPFVSAYYDVVYEAGRATVPADLLLAIRKLVKHTWAPRRGPTGRGTPADARATDRTPGSAYLLPYEVSELIAPYIQHGVG